MNVDVISTIFNQFVQVFSVFKDNFQPSCLQMQL